MTDFERKFQFCFRISQNRQSSTFSKSPNDSDLMVNKFKKNTPLTSGIWVSKRHKHHIFAYQQN